MHDADEKAKMGGPGASCRLKQFSKLCWALLDHVINGKNYFSKQVSTRLDFFSFHKKGGKRGKAGNSHLLLKSELDTLAYMHHKYPQFYNNITIYNDEGDPVTGWDEPMDFRADVRYPAMVVKLISRHLLSTDKLFINYRMTSNDNAFLSYAPHYFTQRTLFARFQVNNTKEPYTALVKKPIYEVMSMLAQMRGRLIEHKVNMPNRNIGLIATRTDSQLCLTLWASNDTSNYIDKAHVDILLPKTIMGSTYIIRTLSSSTPNTNDVWRKLGSPANLTQTQLETMWNVTMIQVTHPMRLNISRMNININNTSIIQIIICERDESPQKPSNLTFLHITENAVLITWKDEGLSDCFLSYKLEFMRNGGESFALLNQEVLLSRSYQFTSKLGVRGKYRVKSTSILGKESGYSEIRHY